ncbi:MAG: Hsp20/alpha crystallin family protein [Gemmatimonadaceae bacterium]|nr:Hsp20/alpha crystallin family protein [Chitinophagaceae bacterium]
MAHLIQNNRPVFRSFNSIFDELFNDYSAPDKTGSSFPPANIVESKDAYHLELNVPGRNKEDFAINIDRGTLTISFEKKEEAKQEDYKTIRREFSFQGFKRSFNLDDKIDAANIQAKYENGLLKLFLPKKPEVKEATKQISVQ